MPGALAGTGYGITETSAVISGLHGSDYAARPDSAGIVIPICEVIAVNDEGQALGRGEPGVQRLRGG